MLEAHETGVPLDLRVGPEEQSFQPDCPTDTPVGQTGHADKSYLVSEEYLKEVERIKEQVVQDLMVFTQEKEWNYKECETVFISPLRVRKHIISKHFSGPWVAASIVVFTPRMKCHWRNTCLGDTRRRQTKNAPSGK